MGAWPTSAPTPVPRCAGPARELRRDQPGADTRFQHIHGRERRLVAAGYRPAADRMRAAAAPRWTSSVSCRGLRRTTFDHAGVATRASVLPHDGGGGGPFTQGLTVHSISCHIYIRMTHKNAAAFLPLHNNWFHILLSLAGAEQHGYGIMQEVLERTDGAVRLWPPLCMALETAHRRRAD